MKKHFKYDSFERFGNNYYPLNGAVFIDLIKDFMFIIPSFPTSVGMVSPSEFELGLHRYPSFDDGLGVGNVSEVSFKVKHSWLIGFHTPDYSFIWKKFLEHRHQPLALFKGSGEELLENMDEAQKFSRSWRRENSSTLWNFDSCAHITGIGPRGQGYLATVLNVCERPAQFPFKVLKVFDLAGLDVDDHKKVWNRDGEMELWIYNNSGRNVFRYPKNLGFSQIPAFEMVSFFSDLEKVDDGIFQRIFMRVSVFEFVFFVGFVVVLAVIGKIFGCKMTRKKEANFKTS
jgi:hypothetical protein